jgi:hypothetical protein
MYTPYEYCYGQEPVDLEGMVATVKRSVLAKLFDSDRLRRVSALFRQHMPPSSSSSSFAALEHKSTPATGPTPTTLNAPPISLDELFTRTADAIWGSHTFAPFLFTSHNRTSMDGASTPGASTPCQDLLDAEVSEATAEVVESCEHGRQLGGCFESISARSSGSGIGSLVKQMCPVTCGTCNAPTASPTAAPTVDGVAVGESLRLGVATTPHIPLVVKLPSNWAMQLEWIRTLQRLVLDPGEGSVGASAMGAIVRLDQGLGRLQLVVDAAVNKASRIESRMLLMSSAGLLNRSSSPYLRLTQELQAHRSVQGHLATARLRTSEILGR